MIPVILARLLQTPPNSTATINPENAQVEQQLIRTIIEFLQYSYQFQIERQSAEPEGSTAAFTNVLLINLRQCVKSVMVSHMEKVKLRQALVSDKSRAEVMHVIVQIGDKIARFAEKQLSLEWVQMREAFMSMLDS